MNRLVVFIIIGVLVLLGAVLLVMAINQNNTQFDESESITNGETVSDQEDITLAQRANMHRLLQEHAVTASLHLQSLYDGEDTTETAENLNENTNDFIALINELSTSDLSGELESIWAEHIELYERYTVALRENNLEQAEQIQNNLIMHSTEFGRVINTRLPNVSSERATQAMTEHVNLTLAVINAHAEDDDSEKIEQSLRASAQAAEFAEVLIPPTEGE